MASQEAIKIYGTNGGGFFNSNSAHPFENPTPLSNFIQLLLIFAIPSATYAAEANASEFVMVDLTPEALQNRLKRGDVYTVNKVEQALQNFFRRGNLIALRELALRQVAEQVDRSLESYMTTKDIRQNWPVRERIAVGISSSPKAQYLVARAARMARRIDAELYVVYVDIGHDGSDADQKSLAANLEFAENLGAKVVRLKGHDVASTTAAFVREKHITQVIFGRSAVEGWRNYLYMSAINRFLREAPAVDVHIVTQEPD